MAKTYSAEMHGNENGSIEFAACLLGVIDKVRQTIADLADSRKADEYAPGALHALRKLCAGEKECGSLARLEVEEWRKTFFAWFDRVQSKFGPTIAKKLRASAEDDFGVLLKVAVDLPEYFWREQSQERMVGVTFKSQAALDGARKAAEKLHPVDLGSALHQYLERCAAELTTGPAKKKKPKKTPEAKASPDLVRVWFTVTDGDVYSLCMDEFACFATEEEREEQVSITGYDVEEATQKYLRKNLADIKKKVQLDSESSLFCARTKDLAALAQVSEVLCRFAADKGLFAQYSPPEKR